MKFCYLSLFAACSMVYATSAMLPLKLDFEIHRGNSHDSMSKDNQVYIDKRFNEEGVAELTLANHISMLVTTIKVGSNNQEVSLEIDTGSSDLWLISKDVNCVQRKVLKKRDVVNNTRETSSAEPPSNTCVAYGSFSTSDSSSFKKNETAPAFNLTLLEVIGTSSTLGVWGHDTIKLRDNTTITDLSFAVVNETTANIGVLGIALPEMEITNDRTPNSYLYDNFPFKLKRDGIIKKVAYSLYLNSMNANGGSVLFGAVDHAKYTGDLKTLPVVNPTRFLGPLMAPLSSIYIVGDKRDQVTESYYPALLQSGSSVSYLPEHIYDKVTAMLDGHYRLNERLSQIPCPSQDSNITFELNFNDAIIRVPFLDLVISEESETGGKVNCFLGIHPTFENYAILGSNILRSGYFVFDLENYTISIAQSRFTDEENIEIISSTIPSAVIPARYSSTSFGPHPVETASTEVDYETGYFPLRETPTNTNIFDLVNTGINTSSPLPATTSKKSDGTSFNSIAFSLKRIMGLIIAVLSIVCW